MEQPHLNKLETAFGFTAEDLSINRAGKISNQQRQTYISNELSKVLMGSVLMLVFGAFWNTIIFTILNLFSGSGSKFVITGAGHISEQGVLLALFFIFGIFGKNLIVTFDLLIGQVKMIEGRVTSETVTRKYSNVQSTAEERRHAIQSCFYVVDDDQRFDVSRTAIDAIHDNGSYRIFYLPRSRKIIGVEGYNNQKNQST